MKLQRRPKKGLPSLAKKKTALSPGLKKSFTLKRDENSGGDRQNSFDDMQATGAIDLKLAKSKTLFAKKKDFGQFDESDSFS